MCEWSGWSGWSGVDTPQTVTTTRAPAVLKSESEKRIFDDLPPAAYLHSSDLWEVTSVEAIHLLQARPLKIIQQ